MWTQGHWVSEDRDWVSEDRDPLQNRGTEAWEKSRITGTPWYSQGAYKPGKY